MIDHILQLLLYLQIHRHILLHRTGHIRKICLASVVKQTCQRHLRHIISRHRLTTALDAMLTHREKFWKMSVRTHHHRESMRNVLDAKLVLLRFKCIKLNFCVSCHAVFHFYPSPQPSTMLSQLREHPPMKVCLRQRADATCYAFGITQLPTQHLRAIFCDKNHNLPLCGR